MKSDQKDPQDPRNTHDTIDVLADSSQTLAKESNKKIPYEKPRVKSYAPLDEVTFGTAAAVTGAVIIGPGFQSKKDKN